MGTSDLKGFGSCHIMSLSLTCTLLTPSLQTCSRLTSNAASGARITRLAPFPAARRVQVHRPRHLTVRMVLTESKDLGIGTKAPDFQLPEPLTGKTVKLSEYAAGAPATLVMFICNHCPFVIHLKKAIVALARDYQSKGVKVVAISSNSVQTHPQDGPEEMAKDAAKYGYTFPYLYDDTQEVAKAYKAACTPEFLVFDSNLELCYHGQFDSSRPRNNQPVTGEDLRLALNDVLAKRPIGRPIVPSIGCNVKWHPGKEPAWFG